MACCGMYSNGRGKMTVGRCMAGHQKKNSEKPGVMMVHAVDRRGTAGNERM